MKLTRWLIVAGSLLAVGCSPSGGPAPSAPADTVVVGLLADIQSWNPYLAEDAANEEVLSLIYPSLAVEQVDYQQHPPSFAPSLAESWEWSEDHLTLTFHLRSDAKWSDGVPVTSEDVLFSWRAQTSDALGWMWSDITDSIEEVEAPDAHTVRYRFTHRYPYQLMDVNDGPIVPAHAWADIPFDQWEETDWQDLVVSAGPFLPGAYTPQQEIILERNPLYFVPDRPHIERLIFRIVPSKTGLYTQLLAGGIDLVNDIPPAEAPRVRANPSLELTAYADRSYTHICWNLQRDFLADPRVRRALGMAIDRQTLIDAVYDGFARPSVGPVLSTMWAFNRDLVELSYDPEGAVKLLAEAGWRDSDGDGILDRDGQPLTFEVLAPSESDVRQDVSLLVERDLARIGVTATPRIMEWGAVQAAIDEGDFDAFINRWIEPTQVDLEEIWHSVPPDVPTFNYGRYGNPEVDRLLEEVAAAADVGAQKPLLDRIQALIVADQPYTFLIENTRLVGLNSRVRGADINDATLFFNVTEWKIVE
jgi:peptide/nickel transport system substrate-binding protein